MRKKIAELAEVLSVEELQQKLKLPAPSKVPVLATQKQSRAPISIKKRFVLMLLMRPSLAKSEHLRFCARLWRGKCAAASQYPCCFGATPIKPAALLHAIESKVDTKLLQRN